MLRNQRCLSFRKRGWINLPHTKKSLWNTILHPRVERESLDYFLIIITLSCRALWRIVWHRENGNMLINKTGGLNNTVNNTVLNHDSSELCLPSWILNAVNVQSVYISDTGIMVVNIPFAIFAVIANLAVIVTIIRFDISLSTLDIGWESAKEKPSFLSYF